MRKIIVGILIGGLVHVSDVSAGGGGSKFVVGAIAGIATGGLSFAVGAPLAAAVTTGATAAIGAAAEGNVRTGVNMDGNGHMTGVTVDVASNRGVPIAHVAPEPQPHIPTPEELFRGRLERAQNDAEHIRLENESKEAKMSFSNWTAGAEYSVFHNKDKVYHVASSQGDTFMTATDRDGWSKCSRNFDILGTQTFANQPSNLIFERTCYEWFFGVEEINGARYNHAWTLTGIDFMVPEGEKHRICAPAWYERQEELKLQEEAQKRRAEQDAPLKEAYLASAEGYPREAIWGTMFAQKEIVHERDGRDFAATALKCYDKAVDTLRVFGNFTDRMIEEMATPGGVENARKFRDGEISAQEYHRVVNEDLKQDAAASMLYSWYGSQGGGLVFTVAGGATSGPAGAAAGEPVGNAIGGATGALAGFVYSRATKAIVRATNSCFKGSGNGGGNKQRLEKVRAERSYNQGKFWNKKRYDKNLSRKSGGSTRLDEEGFAYKFDPAHKTEKVHLHKYRNVGGDKWKLIEEIDPETGDLLRIVENGKVEIWG